MDCRSQGRLDTVSALLAKLAEPLPPQRPNANVKPAIELKAVPGTANNGWRIAELPASGTKRVLKGPQPKTAEGLRILRRRGRQLLLDAYVDGSLDKVARAQSMFVPDMPTAKALEFRRRARQTLLESQSDGRLEMLIFALSWSYSDVEPCREQLSRGRLEQVQKLHPVPAAKGLKSTLQSTLKQPLTVSWYRKGQAIRGMHESI